MRDYSDFDSLLPAVPFNRRQFMVSAIGAGFALAVQPVVAQTVITTDSVGLSAGEIKVTTGDGEMPAYRAQPASGGNWPIILVVQEIFGVHEYIKDVCRRLAKLGYLALAPELYARQGDPRQYSNIEELLGKVVSKVPDAQVLADLDACVAWAVAHGGNAARLGHLHESAQPIQRQAAFGKEIINHDCGVRYPAFTGVLQTSDSWKVAAS